MSSDPVESPLPQQPDTHAESATDWLAQVRATFRRLGPAGVLAAIAATFPALGGFILLYFIDDVGQWLKLHYLVGPVAYVFGFILLAGFALLPTYAQSIVGGWSFGMALGFPLALMGFTGASLISYTIARRASGDRVLALIDEHAKWRAVYCGLVRGGFWRTLGIVTLVRLPPNSPFALTNLVMASTRVPIVPFILGTVFGMAPRTGLVVFLAAGLKSLKDEPNEGKWMFVCGLLITIGVVALLCYLGRRALNSMTAADVPPLTAPKPAGQQ